MSQAATMKAIDDSGATHDQVIAAFLRYMQGPDAVRALRLVPMSKLDAFMDLTMGPKVVAAFLELETKADAKPKWLTAMNASARELHEREQRYQDAELIECFLAVLLQYLVDEDIGYGFDHIIEGKYGGTGVYNGGVSIRCTDLNGTDRLNLIRAVMLVASLFDSRLSSMLDLEAIEFDQDGIEDYTIHINFSDLTMTNADQEQVIAASFAMDNAFYKV